MGSPQSGVPALRGNAQGPSSAVETDVDGFEVLDLINFQMETVSGSEMSGRFVVCPTASQPFKVLHGGITAYISETLASMGAQIASGWARIAGIELNVNHLRAAPMGVEVFVKAAPLMVGKRIQVWEVKFSSTGLREDATSREASESVPIAVSRVTLIVGLPEKNKAAMSKLQTMSKL